MRLVRATSEEQVRNALKNCSGSIYNQRFNNAAFICAMAAKFSEHAEVRIAEVENVVAGFAAYYRNDYYRQEAYLSMIVVRREFQRRGIGALLMDEVERDCRQAGFRLLRLEVDASNVVAQEFYRGMGFVLEMKSENERSLFLIKKL